VKKMGVLKNDVGRPSKKTKIIRGVLKLIGILIIIAAGLGIGYVIGNNQDNKEGKESNNKIEISNEKAEEELVRVFEDYLYDLWYFGLDLNTNEVKSMIALNKTPKSNDKYDIEGNFESTYDILNEVYVYEKSYDVETYRASYKNEFFEYDVANKKYKDLFGIDNNISKKNLEFDQIAYIYSKNLNVFASALPVWGDGAHTVIGGVVESYKLEDKLYITVVYGDVGYNDVNNNELILNDGTIIILTDEETNNKETYKKYSDKMEKYTFEFFLENGIYKFDSVEKNK
jgi:hypothetical protein